MAVHALTEVEVVPGQARQALRTAVRLARRLARRPGFRSLRIYRSQTSEVTLLILAEWAEWDAAAAAETDQPIAALLAEARGVCARWGTRRLEPLFQLQLPHRRPTAGVAQTLRAEARCTPEMPAGQKEFGLKAMALPGTIGVLGGRCTREPDFFFCALEFESDGAADDFAGSITWHEWLRRGESTLWRKEPRLDLRPDRQASPGRETKHRSERFGSLSVHIESTPDGAAVVLRLHGYLDEAAASRFVRVREAVVACGCRELTLDVSQLAGATPEGLRALIETARQVKAAGGRFTMADNQGRYHRIVRSWHLSRAVDLAEGPTPRRKIAATKIRSSGRA